MTPPRAATTSVLTVVEITSPNNVRNSHYSVVNASSLVKDIKRIAPTTEKVVDRHKVPRKKKKPPPPEMRIKAPKRKTRIRARTETGPSSYKE